MLTVDRKQFSRAIEIASSVIERRSTIPALASVKLIANGVLAVEATNLDNSIRVEMVGGGEGEFCLSSPNELRAALEIVGGETVEIERVGKKANVKSGALSGAFSSLPADENPGFSPPQDERFSCTLDAASLGEIQRVSAAICYEETRYYLNGIRFTQRDDGRYRFAATNGHVLMWNDIALPDVTGELPEIILHRGSAKIAFARFADAEAVRFVMGGGKPGRAWFSAETNGGRFSLCAKLIDGSFPDVERVIPTANEKRMTVSRADLAQAVDALSSFVLDKRKAIIMALRAGGLFLRINSANEGDAAFEIAATHDEINFEIGFNGNYLTDILRAMRGDTVQFLFADPAAPTIVTDPADAGFGAVIMPMKF